MYQYIHVTACISTSTSLRVSVHPRHCVYQYIHVTACISTSTSLRVSVHPRHCVYQYIHVTACISTSTSLRVSVHPHHCVYQYIHIMFVCASGLSCRRLWWSWRRCRRSTSSSPPDTSSCYETHSRLSTPPGRSESSRGNASPFRPSSSKKLPFLLHRLEEAEARHGATSREQAEVIGQLRQEVVEVTTTFRGQLHSLQEEHQRVAASLREELRLSEGTVTRLQQVST